MNGKIHIISDIKYKAMEQRNKFIGNARPPFDKCDLPLVFKVQGTPNTVFKKFFGTH